MHSFVFCDCSNGGDVQHVVGLWRDERHVVTGIGVVSIVCDVGQKLEREEGGKEGEGEEEEEEEESNAISESQGNLEKIFSAYN
mmetsp:Transcript_10564/g.14144  ORF Transcript_10564/g.14144 Transcript_10564/m.14144 type:complete len:84 (-) Transcript_10564:200-451(-)